MKRLQFVWLLIYFLLLGRDLPAQQADFEWPNGKKAAVCMTYDDGILSQLDKAIPDLNRAGFSGTFYLTGMNMVPEFVDRWRAAAAQGHELGCHSLFHPCSGEFDWVPVEYQSEAYTVRRILDEATVMNQFLYAVDGKSKRTYAYTCYETEVGGLNYVDRLDRSAVFKGARGGLSPEPVIARDINLFDIPSMSITDEVPLEETFGYIESAMESRSVAVFCFHGVGGDYIVTSREYHQQIIDFLKENEDQIWVATMVEIASYLDMMQSK